MRSWRGQTEIHRVALRVFRGGSIEQVGSAVSPLDVYRLYGDGHRQLRRHGTGRTSRMGGLLAAPPALPAAFYWPILVRSAVWRQVAQRARRRRIGVNAMANRTPKKSAKVARKAADNNAESDTAIKKSRTASKERREEDSPSQLIDARIKKLGDWRGAMLARVRALIRQADSEVIEEVKWRKPSNSMLGVPVWEHDGIICTGETYKAVVKLTFARGALLEDPAGLFNSSLEGNVRRAIDFHEGDKIDEKALKALIRAAVALNTSVRAAARPVRSQKRTKRAGGAS